MREKLSKPRMKWLDRTVLGIGLASLLPESVRGTGFGVLATVNGLGDFVSSAVVGSLWAISPVWAMLFVIATSLAGSVIILNTRVGHTMGKELLPVKEVMPMDKA